MRVRYGAVENTGSMVLSRSVCYALLAGLAVALLIQAYATPGAGTWSAAQFTQTSAQGFHFSQLLVSARISAGILREELHNTWLFLYVFLVVWMIVLAWSLLERRRLQLGVGRREVYWLGWMTLAIGSVAVLYGAGTNGMMAIRYPKMVPVSDGVALAFVLSLPVFAWSRMQRRGEEEHEPVSESRPLPSMLHLNDDDSSAPARARFQEPMMQQPEEGIALPNFLTPAPNAHAVAAVDRLLEAAAMPAPQLETAAEPVAMAIPADAPVVAPSTTAISPSTAAAPVSASVSLAPLTDDFRENLKLMNSAWGRIENAGQEIDKWFDEQRRQVIARLEMHPRARTSEAPAPLQENFLNDKLTAVDADWAAIRRSALEISRWFGDVPPAGS